MNRIELWQRMHREAEKAFPKGFSSPSAEAGVQPDNGKLWIAADHYGVLHADALGLAHWILDICGNKDLNPRWIEDD